MKLSEIINTNDNRDIDNLMLDSRVHLDNSIFFCVEGLTNDAHNFVDQAIRHGAVVIVHRKPLEEKPGVYYHQVNDVTAALNNITDTFYHHPSREMFIYSVTGTNGKTTIMKTLQNILLRFNIEAGYIGTISVEYKDIKEEPSLTTPDVVKTTQTLSEMNKAGVNEVCMEVSSQGLSMRRVENIDFDLAIFTNLSHDHLDYHKDMEDYFNAKEILFKGLKDDAPMFINSDDPYGLRLINKYPNQAISYGLNDNADYSAENIILNSDSTEFTLVHKNIKYDVYSNFMAEFNVYNMLAVISVLHYRGWALETIIEQLKDINPVPGRLKKVNCNQNFDVFVDFGHAPDSMEKVYKFVRSNLDDDAKLITVFGAAGARDHSKRPIMGEIASKYCDHIILTEHDNRNENVQEITSDIISGIEGNHYEFVEIRYDAIKKAISLANEGDAVVLIGKGEERFIYREYGKEEWMGDDIAAQQVLERGSNGSK